jgi:hypothetical protein
MDLLIYNNINGNKSLVKIHPKLKLGKLDLFPCIMEQLISMIKKLLTTACYSKKVQLYSLRNDLLFFSFR